MRGFEAWLRRLANVMGIDISRYRPERTESGRLVSMLAAHRIDLVIDVGANEGQFAAGLRRSGYIGTIVSFEPLLEAHTRLSQRSADDHSWHVPPRTAVGAAAGTIGVHVSRNSVSSSVLSMLPAHGEAAPQSTVIGSETVQIDTLDRLLRPFMDTGQRIFLKIDTQGFEDRVLVGAAETLKRARGVQLELSLVPLYEGQVLADELIIFLRARGFIPWAFWPAFFDDSSGRMLQMDATFFREENQG